MNYEKIKQIVNSENIQNILSLIKNENILNKIEELKVEIKKSLKNNNLKVIVPVENNDQYELPSFPIKYIDRFDLIDFRPLDYQKASSFKFFTASLFIVFENDFENENYSIEYAEIDITEGVFRKLEGVN